ncbi:MAG TPA: hypothetical protein VKT31_05965 [Solirubrobacteraceae bacterium]|nr:hypothetical protein [Solirubrobacteraceae bacterium]
MPPPVVPPPPPVAPPPPLEPPPVVPPPALAPPELAAVEPLELLDEELTELDGLDPELTAAVVLVVWVLAVVAVLEVCVAGAAMLVLGTVSGGASTVSAATGVLELPQPTTATLAPSTASVPSIRLVALTIGKLRLRAAPSGARSAGSR